MLPERFPEHEVAIRKTIPRTWSGQCQQKPMPASGNLINPNSWRYYNPEHLPSFDLVLVSVDASFKGTQDSDFVCLQKWGFVGNKSYLLELEIGRWDFSTTKAHLRSMAARGIRASLILVEDAANGPAIIDDLRRSDFPATVVPVKPEGGKLARAMSAEP